MNAAAATPNALFTQDNPQAAKVAQKVTDVLQTATAAVTAVSAAASTPGTVEEKVNATVQTGGQIAEALAPGFAPVIAVGVELEPAIYHAISALIHFFHKPKPKTVPPVSK